MDVTRPDMPARVEEQMNKQQHFNVLIVGAGLSGVGTASHIRREHPHRTIAILERRESLGGTWDLFRYPGVRSDSDMYSFSYNFRPWQDSKVLADGSAIRQYIADTAREEGVDRMIHYGLKIVAADWSTEAARWTVTAHHEATGEVTTYTADFLVTCTGYYDHDRGYLPQYPGLESFEGDFVHPQHWPEDLDCTDKRVVVIGSGATAVTLVPALAATAAHVTMLQRSPSYVFSIPALDKISHVLGRFLPNGWVYESARKRQIFIQSALYKACRRWPRAMRRFLLSQVRRQVGADFDMSHFTPTYMPWDERLCAVPDGDLFKVLKSGQASVVTDRIQAFTSQGITLESGELLEADVVVSATGLNLQTNGGMNITVDGTPRPLNQCLTYKGVLVEGVPNMAWIFGYTNASWTLKSDIAGAYLCRLFTHMDARGATVATPSDTDGSALDHSIVDQLQSGYVQRGKDHMPRQGATLPWKIVMNYETDSQMLLRDPVDDGALVLEDSIA